MKYNIPFSKKDMVTLKSNHDTPFYIYDEKGIRENAKNINSAFAWNKGFKEYFAVKATPNPHIQKILKEEGFGFDCSSMGELILSEKVGSVGEEIMFTSNNTPKEEYKKAMDMRVIINLDDITQIKILEESAGIPEIICFRYNPGADIPEEIGHNSIIGDPRESKYGLRKDQLFEGYKQMKEKGVKRFGLHSMIISNSLDDQHFTGIVRILLKTVKEISRELDISFEFINMGGGLGIPYKPQEQPIDIKSLAEKIKKVFSEELGIGNESSINLYLESGRYVTGPFGFLVMEAINTKDTYKKYIGVDACMSSLMRPAIYGAYHHISVLGKDGEENSIYDIVGSLCENNDKFAIDRKLPEINIGDLLVVHDVGAHGLAMGYQYNAKLRPAEFLLESNSEYKLIRRKETLDDYFSTLDFDSI